MAYSLKLNKVLCKRFFKYVCAYLFLLFMSSVIYAAYQNEKKSYLTARKADSEYYWCIDDTSHRYSDIRRWLDDRHLCDIEFKKRYYK